MNREMGFKALCCPGLGVVQQSFGPVAQTYMVKLHLTYIWVGGDNFLGWPRSHCLVEISHHALGELMWIIQSVALVIFTTAAVCPIFWSDTRSCVIKDIWWGAEGLVDGFNPNGLAAASSWHHHIFSRKARYIHYSGESLLRASFCCIVTTTLYDCSLHSLQGLVSNVVGWEVTLDLWSTLVSYDMRISVRLYDVLHTCGIGKVRL